MATILGIVQGHLAVLLYPVLNAELIGICNRQYIASTAGGRPGSCVAALRGLLVCIVTTYPQAHAWGYHRIAALRGLFLAASPRSATKHL